MTESVEQDIWDDDGTFSSEKVAQVYEKARHWPPEQKEATLKWLKSAVAREKIRTRYSNAAELASAVDRDFVITPALKLIADAIETVLSKPRHNLLITTPPQEGKLVDMRAPVPTPGGWRKHGELAPGDWVFHPSGTPIRVLAKHPDDVADRRVHFSDHTHLDVHRFHEWTVWDRSRHGLRTVDTADMELVKLSDGTPGRRGHRYRFQLPFREAVDLPDMDLLIDPYTLGVWLGDGTSTKAAITHHPDDEYDLPYVRTARCVHPDTGMVTDYYRDGLHTALKELGVFGNKHIPAKYLRGSISQRRALLAGLIDTDGCVHKSQVSFDNANEQLVRDTAELIRSLGYRAHVHRPTEAKLSSSGIQGVQVMWRVTFSPHDHAPARLPRKMAKFVPAMRRRVAITRIEKLDTPGTGNCITVDSEDGLYLVGDGWTPTHNSTMCAVWAPIRAWQLNPNRRVILSSYGDDLARTHSNNCRSVIESHGSDVVDPLTGARVEDKLGLKISSKSRRIDAWRVEGARGGMVAVGLGSAITGRAADLFIIDDPYKNMQEADSITHREKVDMWMSSVALTRLSPEASIILVQTRWHPEDLAGKVLAAEAELPPDQRTWRYLNIPAVAEEGVTDSLNRKHGTAMISARGRTRKEFDATRRQVGERVWYALYQGMPTNPAGGLFERAWFDPRVDPATIVNPIAAVVAIDPADSGEGDETGIVGGVLTTDGTVVLTEDWSGLYTADQWGRRAVEMALTIGAREIAMEGYATYKTYESVLKRSYTELSREAREALATGQQLTATQQRALSPHQPFIITKYTEAGDPVGRAASLRQALEIKRARVVEYKLGLFEDQAADWQAGQHCPDRVAAAVICHWRLSRLGSGQTNVAAPFHTGGSRPAPEWLTRKVNTRRSGLPFSSRRM